MDPFTQRMLERARARQEKIDQKLATSGQAVPKRKPLSENITVAKCTSSPAKSPIKVPRDSITSPRKSLKSDTPVKTGNKRPSLQKSDKNICGVVSSPQRGRNDVIVTKKEFKSPKRGSLTRRNSDVSVEINISHRNDIQIEVQVEERDAPICVTYNSQAESGNNVIITEIEEDTSNKLEKELSDMSEQKSDKTALRHNFKSRLDRLGNLYSDKPNLSSPIHRTELEFTSATPPKADAAREPPREGKKKFGRLAALADQINNWEDDLTHHSHHQPEQPKKATKAENKNNKLEESTLDVSIHSFMDINKVLQSSASKSQQTSKAVNTRTFTKPAVNECQRLQRNIVAELVSTYADKTMQYLQCPYLWCFSTLKTLRCYYT